MCYFGERDANTGVTYGLLDSTSIENFMTTLKVLQEKWDSIEKKNGHAKGNQYSFYEWFLHEKSETIKTTVLSSTHKACRFTTLDDVNGKEYVPEFNTNDIENVNS